MCIAQALMHVHIVTTILLSVNGLAMLCDISSGHNKPSDYISSTQLQLYALPLQPMHTVSTTALKSL